MSEATKIWEERRDRFEKLKASTVDPLKKELEKIEVQIENTRKKVNSLSENEGSLRELTILADEIKNKIEEAKNDPLYKAFKADLKVISQ